MKSAGICTIKGLQMTVTKRLVAIKGLSEAKIDKIKETAKKLSLKESPFLTANEVSVQRKSIFKISTGSDEFESVLSFTNTFSFYSFLKFNPKL